MKFCTSDPYTDKSNAERLAAAICTRMAGNGYTVLDGIQPSIPVTSDEDAVAQRVLGGASHLRRLRKRQRSGEEETETDDLGLTEGDAQ